LRCRHHHPPCLRRSTLPCTGLHRRTTPHGSQPSWRPLLLYQQTTSHVALLGCDVDRSSFLHRLSLCHKFAALCVVLTRVCSGQEHTVAAVWLKQRDDSAVRACAHKRVGDACDWRCCRCLQLVVELTRQRCSSFPRGGNPTANRKDRTSHQSTKPTSATTSTVFPLAAT
jgi:hypothetical protein